MKKIRTARFELMMSMIIFGTLGLFVRKIPLGSGELAFARAALAVLFIGIYLIVTKKKVPFSVIKKELPLLFASGVAIGVNWMLLFEAYRYTTVSVATLSYYFAPVLVTVVCPVLFHEKLTAKQIFCFVMSTAGLVLLIGAGGMGSSGLAWKGILYGLGAAVFYAVVILINKFIRDVAGIHRTFFQFLAAVVVLAPYVLASGGLHGKELSGSGWVNLLIVGLLHTGITYCMYFSSLKDLKGQEAAMLSYMDPLVAVLVSVLALGEKITVWQLAGGALILGFTWWNEIGVKKS